MEAASRIGPFGIHTPYKITYQIFLCGVDGSHATGMGILGSDARRLVPGSSESFGIPVGTLGAVPALGAVLTASFFDTAEKEGGKGSSRASFANEEGITSGMGYTRAATGFQVINNPCLYQGHRHLLGTPGHQRLPAVKWSSTIPRLYQVINIPSFIPGH